MAIQKYNEDTNITFNSDIEYHSDGTGIKHIDLYDESKYVEEKIIRVKRIGSINTNERWNVFENKKIIYVVDGSKLTKKEKEYLRTPQGFQFLIEKSKNGINSMAGIKKELKKVVV